MTNLNTVPDAVNAIYVSPFLMSHTVAHLGDIDEAMRWLEKAYNEHDAALYVIKYYPWVPVSFSRIAASKLSSLK